MNIFDIPCTLPESLHIDVQGVLEQIGAVCPNDLERLQKNIRSINAVSQPDRDTGNWGEFKADDIEDRGPYGLMMSPEGVRGTITIATDLDKLAFRGVLAHEFGHAATTLADLESRIFGETEETYVAINNLLGEEWKSELAADWYAECRWGFTTEINQIRGDRDIAHHTGGLGGTIEGDIFGRSWRLRIDDQYVVQCVSSEISPN